jgi:hypothetical protein
MSELIVDYISEKEAHGKKADERLKANDNEVKRLVENLDELEGRIKVAIDKGTGYTLFHSFQVLFFPDRNLLLLHRSTKARCSIMRW